MSVFLMKVCECELPHERTGPCIFYVIHALALVIMVSQWLKAVWCCAQQGESKMVHIT